MVQKSKHCFNNHEHHEEVEEVINLMYFCHLNVKPAKNGC